jgi:uncharacterized RDD family membrane protein YckC
MTNTGDTLQIDTPENVTFDYDVAGIGSRFLAALVDTILIALLDIILIGASYLLNDTLQLLGEGDSSWLIAILSMIAFIFFWGYYIFFEIYWNGQTPGKRWVKIRIIRLDGTPVTAAEVVIRNLLRVIDLLPIAYAVGVVCMFMNDKSRRLGDLAAGTLAVHERNAAGLIEAGSAREKALATVIANGEAPENFPLERLKERDRQMIEDYLLRRARLPNRTQLAGHILASLYARLGLPPESIPSRDADDVLAAIYRAVRSRGES